MKPPSSLRRRPSPKRFARLRRPLHLGVTPSLLPPLAARDDRRELGVVAVVVPCYRVAQRIDHVVRSMPAFVRHIIVVDDACPVGSGDIALSVGDPRVVLLRHGANRGVGGAMKTGFEHALSLRVDVVVKMDGDGQMDPSWLPKLIEPLMRGRAAFTKGNRLRNLRQLSMMPFARRMGNIGLSFLTKVASGYWHISDPTNGYVALRSDVLASLDVAALSNGYYFETSLLVELGKHGFRIEEVAMPPRYDDEPSSLSIVRALFGFPPRLLKSAACRFAYRHFWHDFTPSALLLLAGLPLVLWGLGFGGVSWWQSIREGAPASAGTVMLAGLPFIIGVNFLLQAVTFEMLGNFNNRTAGGGSDS